ncbi:fumarylacetoacetate hydrolase family protein [Phenylobacterium sp.]|uniref:fumarylacetoacetate hydrolase family protein n=1 Tax=Phenylobacterium sp. TaxID=1871053 RepID=UPI002811321C|nr:fumarylacetoacetate hydrolase family protein [Phenylobacterium sp.]
MAEFAIAPAPVPTVPVEGEAAVFPVRRILCVGQNYAAHRAEMGGDDRNPPFFFSKPADAVAPPGRDPAYPSATANLHHEIELVVAIGKAARNVSPDAALDLIFGYAVGVDLTRRDLQAAAKGKGQPWDSAKGFDDSAPISAIRRWSGAVPAGRIRLSVNGQVRQDASLTDMIWNVAEIVSEASRLWALAPGDLIFTGTPEGVGPLVRGDRVEGEVEGVGQLSFTVT